MNKETGHAFYQQCHISDIRCSKYIRSLHRNVSYTSTSYYNKGIITIRKCLKINSFPNISSKIIYGHLLDIQPPRIQDNYPLYNWKYIWKNLHFKYLHENLSNKHILKQIKRSRDDLCEMLNLHTYGVLYYCTIIVRPNHSYVICENIAVLVK